MRRLWCVLAALSVVLLGCGPEITEEEVQQAVMVTYQAVLSGSIAVAAGVRTPGVRSGDTRGTIRFSDYNVSGYGTPYTSINGTVGGDSDTLLVGPGEALVDVSLSGGPIETLAFVVDLVEIQTATSLSTTAIVNGGEREVSITDEVFGQ
jgi:hypothetical protein